MKNKKIIFLVATVCCLAVCWFCFGAWSISDTDLTVGDFTYSQTTTRLYVVPSPNVSSSDIANIRFYSTVTRSSQYYDGDVPFTSFTSSNNIYRYDMPSAPYGNAITINYTLSSYNSSVGTYFISAAYIYSDSALQEVQYFSTNFVRYSFAQYNYRTVILFIDKLTTVSQAQYDQLLQRYEDLEYDFSDLESDYDDLLIEAREYYAMYEQELALNTALNTQISELQARIDSLESGGTALDFVGTAFEKVGDILQIEILPNITIGTIVAVPLILGVVFLVLRLVRGE